VDEVSALFWDMGGVILTNAWDRASRRRASEKFHLDWEDFEDRHELLLNAFETGQASLDEYLSRVVFYRARPFTREEFKQFMFEQSQPCAESLAILAQIAARGTHLLASLNNESLELNDYRIEKFGLRDYFQAFLSSCYLGVRKPDNAIYRLALHITQRRPGECLFIDDRPLNLECAQELGMRTIHYQNSAQLREGLEHLGVPLDGK
jgi:putative hydrolase of the HAD superfamily